MLILLLLVSFALGLEVRIVSNYPLKKNNFKEVIDEENYERIIYMLKQIPEFRSVRYERKGDILTIYIERYPLVKRIDIEGNVYFRKEDIKNILGIEEDTPLTGEDEEVFKEILLQAYRNEGFLGANVDVRIDVNQSGDAFIKIKVRENNLYFLGGAEFPGARSVPKEELLRASGLVVGSVFDIDAVEDAEEKLETYYRRKGFYQSFVFLKALKKKTLKRRFTEALFPKTDGLLSSISLGLRNAVNHPLATLKALWGGAKVGIPVYEVFEGEHFRIEFEGNTFFSEDELRSLLDLKTVGLDIFTLEKLKERIEELYRRKGFLDVRVEYRTKKGEVLFRIREGERYRAFVFINGERYTFPYDRDKIEKMANERLKELKRLGYLDATLKIEEKVDKEKKLVYVFIRLKKGFRYVIADIRINDPLFSEFEERIRSRLPAVLSYELLDEVFGKIRKKLRELGYFDAITTINIKIAKTEDILFLLYEVKINRGERYRYGKTVVYGAKKTKLREVNYMLVKSEYFSRKNEEESMWNMLESEIFRSAQIETYVDKTNKRVHRLVTLQENKRGVFELGLGYSTFENFKFSFGITLRNLFGTGLVSRNTYSRSQRFELYRLSLQDRFFFSRHYFTDASLFKTYENHEFYDLFSDGYALVLGYRFSPMRFLSFSFSRFRAKTTGAQELTGRYNKYTLTFFRRGAFRASASRANGKRNYTKLELFGRVKREFLPERAGFRLKSAYGYVSKDAPIFERFFLGGYTMMKGYAYESIGAPLGGRQFLYVNPEFYLLFKKSIEVITFFELGKTASTLGNLFEGMKKDAGLSAGLRTPVGLIRGDVAYPLEEKSLRFSKLRFYISVDLYF
ncbi:MAG: BamA/TamA family outer membrane protein [Aquificae bacterium]|nr:BamA/TamA family outer membrane protein [Aquificota bacterium]